MNKCELTFNNIEKYVDSNRTEIIDLLKRLVNVESGSRYEDHARNMAIQLKKELITLGLAVESREVGYESAPMIIAKCGKENEMMPVMLTGHYDTVFPNGYIKQNPFKTDEKGYFYGPGCYDMKGGIAIAAWTSKTLMALNYLVRPIKLVFVGDEEKGHINANTAEILMNEAENCICAFNMESGILKNDICVGRRGCAIYEINVTGKCAHSGAAFADGRNAIVEMAYKITELHKLTRQDEGVTVSVNLIQGGSAVNCVAPSCKAIVDSRYILDSQMRLLDEEVRNICAQCYIDGTSTEVKLVEQMPPFEKTDTTVRLAKLVSSVSERNGLGRMEVVTLGGSSDASYISKTGIPVICAMGVRGEHNHTPSEYGVIESLFERIKLLCLVYLTNFEGM